MQLSLGRVGPVGFSEGFPTDYIMYITVLYWGGWWTLGLHTLYLRAVKMRKGDAQGWVNTAVLFNAVPKHRVT
jgi:hypothetical protein